jgi:two-component system chemotaxis response regulator CheB
VVQDPNDAEFNSMPLNACSHVNVDYVVPASKIGALLSRLAGEQASGGTANFNSQNQNEMINQDVKSGEGTSYSCPECSGPLLRIKEEDLIRFRCRLGHAYGPETLRFAQSETAEALLWSALQSVAGRAEFEDELQRLARVRQDESRAQKHKELATKSRQVVELLKQAIDLLSSDTKSTE